MTRTCGIQDSSSVKHVVYSQYNAEFTTATIQVLERTKFANYCGVHIHFKEPIMELLYRAISCYAFAITPPKVNGFGWNLEHCTLLRLAPADFGRDPVQ